MFFVLVGIVLSGNGWLFTCGQVVINMNLFDLNADK